MAVWKMVDGELLKLIIYNLQVSTFLLEHKRQKCLAKTVIGFLWFGYIFFAIFSRQTRQLELEDFQKGLKNIYIKYPILKSNLEYRNFLDCLQNEG